MYLSVELELRTHCTVLYVERLSSTFRTTDFESTIAVYELITGLYNDVLSSSLYSARW
jgi:hypothetical protein